MGNNFGAKSRFAAFSLAALAVSVGCNSFDEEQDSPVGELVRIVPTDERPVSQPEEAPPPILGGTMLALGDTVAVADPARHRVSLMQPGQDQVRHVALEVGAQPFRMTLGADGSLYVVLRGTGEVAKINVAAAAVEQTLSVCAAPRGIDYDAINDELVVACAEGKLVSIDPAKLESKSELTLDADLRDVVVQGDRRYVSRFRSAEILFIDDGVVSRRVTPPTVLHRANHDSDDARTLRPAVAWKMVSDPAGGVVVSHQRAVVDSIGIDPHAEDGDEVEGKPTSFGSDVGASPYGGSDLFGCDGIVQATLTSISATGEAQSSAPLSGVTLPVDLAISADGQSLAVANAGSADPEAPTSHIESVLSPGSNEDLFQPPFAAPGAPFNSGTTVIVGKHSLHPVTDEGEEQTGCLAAPQVGASDDPVTAVVFTSNRRLLSQDRAHAVIHEVDPQTFESTTHPLGGAVIRDTGHELFHRDSGGGLACASCHPEGEDDGNVWTFAGIGPRRTQNLGLPLQDTAPFHWDGSLPNLSSLMDDVFVERMGGVFQSPERLAALEGWMFSRTAVKVPAENKEAAARGKKLFESQEVGCGTCHSGSGFTDNQSYDVGTTSDGVSLQVPPLNGLLLRPPYMHNGCAKTLKDRFDAECGGGDTHGRTSHLSVAEIEDLVSYMSTL